MKTERPYCNAPWLGLFFEGTRGCAPCCEWKGEVFPGTTTEYRKSDYLKDFKNLMYSDKMHPNCIECETNEKVNSAIGSTRKFYNSYDLESLCAGEEVCPDSNCNSPDGITKIVKLDFRAGNKCNMMCRMCGPQASSLIEEEAIIFVHDGVRCLVSQQLIHHCYNAAIEFGSAIPVIGSADSLRIIKGENNEILDRDTVRLVQTPQTFHSKILLPAFNIDFKEKFTDEATVVEAFGLKVHLVEGEETNIKITNPIDLLIAEKIVSE